MKGVARGKGVKGVAREEGSGQGGGGWSGGVARGGGQVVCLFRSTC